jgi:hypothetical protein
MIARTLSRPTQNLASLLQAVTPFYFSLSATLESAAFAQAASLSPPGAPLTETAPTSWSPTLIGTPPMALMVPEITGAGTGAPAGRLGGGPEALPKLYATVIGYERRVQQAGCALGVPLLPLQTIFPHPFRHPAHECCRWCPQTEPSGAGHGLDGTDIA